MKDGMIRHKALNGGAPQGWRKAFSSAEPTQRDGSPPPTLYAVVSSWYEADVIGSTVRNCFAQGCSRVYLLDNASPDDTVAVATKAGATVAEVYATDKYDDDLRTQLQNDLVKRVTEAERLPDLWWLTLDADEFPCVAGGTVLSALTGLPRRVRVVGGNAIDLYPTGPDQYRVGEHPAACMPYGVWRRGGINRYCECGHWKHPLARYLDGRWDVAQSRGCHHPAVPPVGPPRLIEPDFHVHFFHAPLRRREHAEARLRALCESGRCEWDDHVTGSNGAVKRWRSLEHVYAGRWDKVELPHTQMYGRPVTGIALYPWRVLAPELVSVIDGFTSKRMELPCVPS